MTRPLEFYFDFSSPFAYLGSTQVERVAQEGGSEVVWKPILLGALFKDIGTPKVPLFEQSEARRLYFGRDMLHWADHWGVPFRFPSRFPMNTILALRTVLAAEPKDVPALVHAIYRVYWAEDRDINDRAVLAEVAGGLGLPAEALLGRTEDPAVKNQLRENTDEAVRRGVYGVPTFFVGETAIFGQDRFDWVLRALGGETL